MFGKPRALLLCAGVGSRLRPLTDVMPKCLMPISGRPLLGYWLQMLCNAGISEILINLHHHAELVEKFVLASPYAQFVTMKYEENLLGTGGTLLENKRFFSSAPVLMAHADNLTQFDPIRFLRTHQARPEKSEMTMMTFKTSEPETCGIVDLDSIGVVKGFYEKVVNPPGNVANAAVYMIEPTLMAYLESLNRQVIDFSTEVIPNFQGRIYTYFNEIYHRDIGTLMSLAQAQLDYPLIKPLCGVKHEVDPWYGLFSDTSGRALARKLVISIQAAFEAHNKREKSAYILNTPLSGQEP